MYVALMEKIQGHDVERAIREFPSEASFLRALDRIEMKAYDRGIDTARLGNSLTVIGNHGEIRFRSID